MHDFDPLVCGAFSSVTHLLNSRKVMTIMMTSLFVLNPLYTEKPDVKGFLFKPNTHQVHIGYI